MSDKNDEKPVAEVVNDSKETGTPIEEAPKEEEAAKEETIGESQPKEAQDSNKDTVPLSKLMAEKKKRQELEAQLREMEEAKQNSLDNLNLNDIADEFGVSPEVVDKMAAKLKAELSEEFNSRFDELTAEDRKKKQDAALQGLLDSALEKHPEYQDVANKEVVLKYAETQLKEGNTNITMSQILKDVYGKVEPREAGIQTTETSNRADTGNESVDFNKLSQMSDEEQMEVLKDPEMRKKYNEYVMNNIQL